MSVAGGVDQRLIKVYCRERDTVLRSLDPVKLDEFWDKWELPKPREGWHQDTKMIMMHKTRLHLENFTEEEKAASRKWLEDHHCSLSFFWETEE